LQSKPVDAIIRKRSVRADPLEMTMLCTPATPKEGNQSENRAEKQVRQLRLSRIETKLYVTSTSYVAEALTSLQQLTKPKYCAYMKKQKRTAARNITRPDMCGINKMLQAYGTVCSERCHLCRQGRKGNASAKMIEAPMVSPTLASDCLFFTILQQVEESKQQNHNVKLKDISTCQAGH
jgi:hypothetical protein